MNRFDRVTSLLLLLQTRTVVTARFLSEHFGVSERTVYRDIRTLENAGVPIGAEAGVGYFLEQGYRLPPIAFTLDEAAALLLGEKLLSTSLDADSLQDFGRALNKVRAVIERTDKDRLSAFDADIEVLPTGSHFPIDRFDPHRAAKASSAASEPATDGSAADSSTADGSQAAGRDGTTARASSGAREEALAGDRWLRECRAALVQRQVIGIEYASASDDRPTGRQIEPIGLFYYHWHWHLIAWCRLRGAYRDFRLDRVRSFAPRAERFARRDRLTLRQYLDERPGKEDLQPVELLFGTEAARFVGEQRHLFGFVEEERRADGVKMRFLTHVPDYMARWLLQYADEVEVLRGEPIRRELERLSARLSAHWLDESKPS